MKEDLRKGWTLERDNSRFLVISGDVMSGEV